MEDGAAGRGDVGLGRDRARAGRARRRVPGGLRRGGGEPRRRPRSRGGVKPYAIDPERAAALWGRTEEWIAAAEKA